MVGTPDRTVGVGAGTADGGVVGPYAARGTTGWADRGDLDELDPVGTPVLLAGAAAQADTQAALDALRAALNDTRADLRAVVEALRDTGVMDR